MEGLSNEKSSSSSSSSFMENTKTKDDDDNDDAPESAKSKTSSIENHNIIKEDKKASHLPVKEGKEKENGHETETATATATATATTTIPSKEDWETQRDHAKHQGDQAFRMGGFKTAIDHYTQAIDLDPDFILAYSNRSAAYLKNSEKSKALRDAEKITQQLDPTFVKGWSRLAAALHSLKRWSKALEAYQKVLELDGGNAVAKKGVADCQVEVDKIEVQRKQFEEVEQARKEAETKAPIISESTSNGDANDKEDDDEDDLLNDFFDEVEDVVTKKKGEKVASAVPTNNIKNEKITLGTAKEQMDRLLQPNFEWRNLNPFYVLQIPHTATEEEIKLRYKSLSLMLHPDKNAHDPRAEKAFDEVKKAKNTVLGERARHSQMLVEEGIKQAEAIFKQNPKGKSLDELKEVETMRIFAQVEQKRRDVESNERKFEQRTQQQEDAQEQKERQARQFDKSWRKEDRVDKRVGNWRDFAPGKKKKRKV